MLNDLLLPLQQPKIYFFNFFFKNSCIDLVNSIDYLHQNKENKEKIMKLISSQRYLDEAIVAVKIENEDFEVQVSPEFEFEGETYRVVMDGHHSYAAAKKAGAEPVFYEQDASDNDRIALLENGNTEDFFDVCRIDSDWYDIETGYDIW